MMRITDEVLLVGSGKYGFELSDSIDCNVYLIDGGTEYALVDAGAGVHPERIVENIKRCGIPMNRVTKLLLTHVHADHAAGARFFRDNYGMSVICAREATCWLETADPNKNSISFAIEGGVYPKDFIYMPCPVDISVDDGDIVRVGNISLRVFDTPGHSRGHICFVWPSAGRLSSFTGDAIFARGKIVTQYIWDCSIQEYAETVRKLDELHLDAIFPGHGTFLFGEAHSHIRIAVEAFARLEVPGNL